MSARHLLILGGTGEAAALARSALSRFGDSMAVTTAPAARLVGRVGRRAWLTVGANSITPFASATGVRFVVRMIDPPPEPLPLRFYEVVTGRGPFSLIEERHLLERHGIDVVVCKASGGAATEAKLIAARELSLPVIMVRRPPAEPGPSAETIDAALDWLDKLDRAPQARRMS